MGVVRKEVMFPFWSRTFSLAQKELAAHLNPMPIILGSRGGTNQLERFGLARLTGTSNFCWSSFKLQHRLQFPKLMIESISG
jgi:hypothetical protein